MANDFDIAQAQHAEEKAVKQAEFEVKLKKMQDGFDAANDQLKKQASAQTGDRQIISKAAELLTSMRGEIDKFIEDFFQNSATNEGGDNEREEAVEVVSLDSDDGASEHEPDNEETDDVQEQSQNAENSGNSVELVRSDQDNLTDKQPAQQNLSNGANHDETVKPNDDNEAKENVRPQSTPIGKVDAQATVLNPLVSSSSAKSIILIVPKAPVLQKAQSVESIDTVNNEPGTSSALQYGCLFCDDCSFPAKSLSYEHMKTVHHKRLHGKKKAKADGKFVRVAKRKHDSDRDDDDNFNEIVSEANGHHGTAMEKAAKRVKKRSSGHDPDFEPMTRQKRMK